MARGGKLGFVCYVQMPDGRTVDVKDLTDAERAQWHENMLQRLSENMSAYYSQHPEEYALL
jgi:hypothetical protein